MLIAMNSGGMRRTDVGIRGEGSHAPWFLHYPAVCSSPGPLHYMTKKLTGRKSATTTTYPTQCYRDASGRTICYPQQSCFQGFGIGFVRQRGYYCPPGSSYCPQPSIPQQAQPRQVQTVPPRRNPQVPDGVQINPYVPPDPDTTPSDPQPGGDDDTATPIVQNPSAGTDALLAELKAMREELSRTNSRVIELQKKADAASVAATTLDKSVRDANEGWRAVKGEVDSLKVAVGTMSPGVSEGQLNRVIALIEQQNAEMDRRIDEKLRAALEAMGRTSSVNQAEVVDAVIKRLAEMPAPITVTDWEGNEYTAPDRRALDPIQINLQPPKK